MKLKLIKKFITIILSCTLLFVSTPHIKIFSALEDIKKLGGSYIELLEEKNKYRDSHPDDHTTYECHHLIAKKALNDWGKRIPMEESNDFLTNDTKQNWAPTITMEKADHEKTLSYCNNSSSAEQKIRAREYIKEQSDRLIFDGNIIGVLKDEINFIRITFGKKYARAIKEVWQYINSLNCRHIDQKTTLIMTNPDDRSLHFKYQFA